MNKNLILDGFVYNNEERQQEIFNTLKLKFPNADFMKDIQLSDHGEGIVINKWNLSEPKPTQKDLDQWTAEMQDQYALNQILLKREATYPPKEDLIVALWERIVEGKTDATDEIQIEREAVKAENPKPGE